MEVPKLITDMAVMLLTAGIAGIIFRKIKLPVILGYIAVGFFISPYFPLFFDVGDLSTINTLSEIGVIIILFHIGLEFDFHKLMKIGSTAVVTAIVKMSGVMAVGYLFARLIGLSKMNSLFLGVMLSISSTVVIKKCFEDLKVTGEKYTQLVMGTLIVEDLISVFMMVVLSYVSVGKSSGGGNVTINLLMMLAYLIVWLVVSVLILPTILNKVMNLLNQEMLIALSLGICFAMALLGKMMGFSVELGAFIAGSVFAGTKHHDKVEKSTESIKDMFSVIFFLSVGMKVDPAVVAERWTSIIPIAIIAVLAKLIFATLGMILSGQRISTAIKSGFSLAPIGEFSYIIASLGISLGVMDSYLYPVIVAASILTTLITPVLINNSGKVTDAVNRHLPKRIANDLQQYTDDDQEETDSSDWSAFLKQYFIRVIFFGVIMLVTAVAGIRILAPMLKGLVGARWSDLITCVLIYMIMILFIRPMIHSHDPTFTSLWLEKKANRPSLVVLNILRVIIIAAIAFLPIRYLFGAHELILFAVSMAAIIILGKTDAVATTYLQLETRFLRNLNEKTIYRLQKEQGRQDWLNEDLEIFSYYVPNGADYTGQTLSEIGWRHTYGILVVKITRKGHSYLLPDGSAHIHVGDKIYIVGMPDQISNIRQVLGVDPNKKIRTLREFMESDYPDTKSALAVLAIRVNGTEPYCGKPIYNTKVLSRTHCMILGVQKKGMRRIMPDPRLMIEEGDVIWVMGSNNNVGRLASYSVTKDE